MKGRKLEIKPGLQRQARAFVLQAILLLLDKHPKRPALIRAGKQRDDLLRALVPLYILKGTKEPHALVSSGTVSKFWKLHGVKIQGPRVARAWRERIGYSRVTRHGRVLTPNGVQYVQHALEVRR